MYLTTYPQQTTIDHESSLPVNINITTL